MVNWLAHKILLSPRFSWWFPQHPLCFLILVVNSSITWKHEVKPSLSISPCHDQELSPSAAYTEYSIHQVKHTPSTAYTEKCIHRVLRHPIINCLLLPAGFSSRRRPCCTQLSTFPQLQVNKWIESQLPARLPPDLPAPNWLSQSTPPFLQDYVHKVHLKARSITASKRITKLAQLWPHSSHHDRLQVHLQTGTITAS
jgi:hypothetical protein